MGSAEPYDAIIVGGGPAGLSAAELLGRCCRSVLLFDDARPRNAASYRLNGFLSRDGTDPRELLAIAHREVQRYPSARLRKAHVAEVKPAPGGFAVGTGEGELHTARRVLLATGVYDALPDVPGLRDEWGKRVFVCPYCDAWEFRDKRLAAIGADGSAAQLGRRLRQWSGDVVICAQDQVTSVARMREDRLQIAFADGRTETCDAVFVTAALRQRSPLVETLGCKRDADGRINVDEYGRTSVPGCYAAGDAATHIHQVALAAASGVAAGIGINEDLLDGG